MSAWRAHLERKCAESCFYCRRDGKRRERIAEIAEKMRGAIPLKTLASIIIESGSFSFMERNKRPPRI